MTTAKTEAIAKADAELSNAGLPTYTALLALLADAQRLGLRFDIGTVYIRREYITQQTAINQRVDAALAAIQRQVAA